MFAQEPALQRGSSAFSDLQNRNNAFSPPAGSHSHAARYAAPPELQPGLPQQPRLAVSEPGDPLEQEAGRQADQALRSNDRTDAEKPQAPSARSLSGGNLAAAQRDYFERRYQHSFADVRVIADDAAGAAASALHARAFTYHHQVTFAPGQYRPETQAGLRLLAHELWHVVQRDRQGSLLNGVVQRSPDGDDEQKTLSNEGVSTGDPVSKKTAGIIDAVIQRNKRLAPFIGSRLKGGFKIAAKDQFVRELSDGNFDDSYRKAYGLSSSDSVPKSVNGFYDYKKSKVHLRPGAEFGTALHEAVHKLAAPVLYTNYLPRAIKISGDLGEVLKEGVTAYFTDEILSDEGLPDFTDAYRTKKRKVKQIVAGLGSNGFDLLAEFNFEGKLDNTAKQLGVTTQDFMGKLNDILKEFKQLI